MVSDDDFSDLRVSTADPVKGCELCSDEAGNSMLPYYGVAPHECFYKRGSEFKIGQSLQKPFEFMGDFLPDMEGLSSWSEFKYPRACGTYFCKNCHTDEISRGWAELVSIYGKPDNSIAKAKGE